MTATYAPRREDRAQRYVELIESYPMVDEGLAAHPDDEPLDHLERFALVEKNSRHGGYWLTTHSTPEVAAAYHDGQEYAEEWVDLLLVDLDSGNRFYGVTSTRWEPHPDQDGPRPC